MKAQKSSANQYPPNRRRLTILLVVWYCLLCVLLAIWSGLMPFICCVFAFFSGAVLIVENSQHSPRQIL